MSEELNQRKRIVEGAIFAAGEPLTLDRMLTLFEEDELPSKDQLREALSALQEDYDQRGIALVEVASGWRFIVREDLARWVNRLWDEKPQKYSRALLETLALVAYRQPVTRGDIEEVRGVAVSSHIMKTLSEREWIKVVGHRDVPGRPSLYATTKQFLDYFNLKSLDELPTLGELKDIDSLNKDLDFDVHEVMAQVNAEREDDGIVVESAAPESQSEEVRAAESSEQQTSDTEGGALDLDDKQLDLQTEKVESSQEESDAEEIENPQVMLEGETVLEEINDLNQQVEEQEDQFVENTESTEDEQAQLDPEKVSSEENQ